MGARNYVVLPTRYSFDFPAFELIWFDAKVFIEGEKPFAIKSRVVVVDHPQLRSDFIQIFRAQILPRLSE